MKHYIAKCLTALTLFFLFLTKGWGIDLRGKVIDRETGDPLVGATLSLPQIGRTTLSDNDGLFSFQLPAQRNYTLTAQYLGYRKQTLTVNPARTDTLLIISMATSSQQPPMPRPTSTSVPWAWQQGFLTDSGSRQLLHSGR